MNYVYPKSEFSNGVYATLSIENDKINQLKREIQKITGKSEKIINQTEYIYRDIVIVEVKSDNVVNEVYCKRSTGAKYNKTTKNLHIIYNIEQIEPHNFPNLNKYHHIEIKEIHQYGDVMLIKNNTHWTVCIKYESKESVEKLYEQIMKLI